MALFIPLYDITACRKPNNSHNNHFITIAEPIHDNGLFQINVNIYANSEEKIMNLYMKIMLKRIFDVAERYLWLVS